MLIGNFKDYGDSDKLFSSRNMRVFIPYDFSGERWGRITHIPKQKGETRRRFHLLRLVRPSL